MFPLHFSELYYNYILRWLTMDFFEHWIYKLSDFRHYTRRVNIWVIWDTGANVLNGNDWLSMLTLTLGTLSVFPLLKIMVLKQRCHRFLESGGYVHCQGVVTFIDYISVPKIDWSIDVQILGWRFSMVHTSLWECTEFNTVMRRVKYKIWISKHQKDTWAMNEHGKQLKWNISDVADMEYTNFNVAYNT